MPAKGPVKIVWQIVFTLIPVLNIWAFYRIKKLRKYILIILIPVTVISMIVIAPQVISEMENIQEGNLMNDDQSILTSIIQYIVDVGFTILSIYLIYKWSKEWNKQFPNAGNTNL